MKHILSLNDFLIKEGLRSEQYINMLVEIILEKIDVLNLKKNSSYVLKSFFSNYLDNPNIENILMFLKENNRNPKIYFNIEKPFNVYSLQKEETIENGSYNPSTSDIIINIYSIGRNLSSIKKTLSHELKHMYDDVARKGTANLYDREDNIKYFDKPSEIRAFITGFINQYDKWDQPLSKIIEDCEDHLKTEKYDRKKLIKLLYQIKSTGLNNHTIIPSTKFKGRESDISKFVIQADHYNVFYNYDKEHRILNIDNSILSVNSIDYITEENGELGYPLLELLLDIYDSKGNIYIEIEKGNLELVSILKDVYDRTDIYNYDNKQVLTKNNKTGRYRKTSSVDLTNIYDKIIKELYRNTNAITTDTIQKKISELGYSDSQLLNCIQKIIDMNYAIYLTTDFYNKWIEHLNIENSDMHYFESGNKGYYLLNAENNKSIFMDRVSNSTNYKKLQ